MAERYIGLISGTSMDGIDAVLTDFEPKPPRVLAQHAAQFDAPVRAELDALRRDPTRFPALRLARLDAVLGDAFAAAARKVMDRAGLHAADIRAIGSHGQTVLHDPDHQPPTTLQIGDPHRIAAQTGVLTVADFRRADLAAGGQGAPLAPLLHRALLASSEENRAVVNLGGIANVSILPVSGQVTGFDTGPANCLLDHWYRANRNGRFDDAGAWAASGRPDPEWLSQLLTDQYFGRSAPKSTGIEYFSPGWLGARLPSWAPERPADIQATLLELSAQSIALALARLPEDQRPVQVIACGGGVHNKLLMKRLGELLDPAQLRSSAEFGLDPDQVEALLFAWLSRERLASRPIRTEAITGAARAVVAGAIFTPPSPLSEPAPESSGLNG
ncbi:anhydro-N-acetylmuramic acid kinase [Wenzhouxiangella limi]|uniref:Anhydro-N-acetylmuramic acid kinase n=1 Tax=Wenzhouxiangella limi TaxID=2707351 RepID=A0A845UVG1_9GAMM|nr:anhydro-N-acetylmuramic acid kinase [Wenzhouxiangella limi]